MSGVRHRELVLAYLAGESTPTVPVAFWQHQPVADQQASTMAEATLAFHRRFDGDLVKLSPASSYQLRDHGMSDTWERDVLGRRTFGAPIATSSGSWSRIAQLEDFAHRDVQIAAAAAVRAGTPRAVPIMATVFGPGFQARTLAGAGFEEQRYRHPAEVSAALEALTRATCDLIDAYLDAGVDAIFYVVQHAHADATAEADYRAVDLPHDLACLQRARAGQWTLVHLHGAAVHTALVADWAPDVVHYDEAATGLAPSHLPGWGPIATGPGSLVDPLGPDVHAVARRVAQLRARVDGRPLMLAPGCSLPLDTAPELVHAATAAARTPTSSSS